MVAEQTQNFDDADTDNICSDDEALLQSQLMTSTYTRKELEARANNEDFDGMKLGIVTKGFADLDPYNPDSEDGERNFSNWHLQLVIRANDQDLSYHARKTLLMSKMRGGALEFIRQLIGKSCKYLVKRLHEKRLWRSFPARWLPRRLRHSDST